MGANVNMWTFITSLLLLNRQQERSGAPLPNAAHPKPHLLLR
jgi:hypothetical protein